MELFEGYAEAWQDYLDRSNHDVQLINYLKTSPYETCISKCRQLLSIGPADGKTDRGLIDLMPNLKQYTAVEPNKDFLPQLQEKMADLTNVKKSYFKETMQTFTGPSSTVDIVLLAHSAYYFSKTFEQQIRRALSWLSDDGHIIFVSDSTPQHEQLCVKFDVKYEGGYCLSLDEMKQQLRKIGFPFTESEHEYSFDLSSPRESNYHCLSVLLNRQASQKEIDEAHDLLLAGSTGSNGYVTMCVTVIVIKKI